MNTPTLSVVIPCFNRCHDVLTLLESLGHQSGIDFEVLLVDDCSSDGTSEAVAARYPAVRVLRNEKNGGPCLSRNHGILASKGTFIVGLDSDVTVPCPFLLRDVARAFQANPDVTALSLRILRPDGVSDDEERWWHPVPVDAFANRRFETDYFTGTGCAFRREAVISAGLFPEVLYMHYEEVELALRLIDDGGHIFYAPDLRVLHHVSPRANRSRVQNFYKPRNQILLAIQCFPWARAARFLAPRLAFHFSRAVLGGHLGDYFEALISAGRLAPRRLSTRRPLTSKTLARIDALRHRSAVPSLLTSALQPEH